MLLTDAEHLLDRFLAPTTTGDFLNGLADGGWRVLPSSVAPARLGVLGTDPAATLLGAFDLAETLTWHSDNATAPAPAVHACADAGAFRRLIDAFHARHYSVRFPNLRPYSAELDAVCRSLEVLLHKPVTASAFWSEASMQAPVHADDHDLLIVQLVGRKRWYVSQSPSPLDNTWERIPGDPWMLGEHEVFDVGPGDAVYLPRGTVHSVDGDETSIHVAIGFTPLTVRDALIATIDHLSDLDRGWRTTVAPFLGHQLASGRIDPIPDVLRRATEHLRGVLDNPAFVAAALQRRSARSVSQMAAHSADPVSALTLNSMLVQRAQSFCHLSANEQQIDVAYPGGHLYVHRGAEQAVSFMTRTPHFRVRDIPGPIDDEVRLSLATRFCEIGLLTVRPG